MFRIFSRAVYHVSVRAHAGYGILYCNSLVARLLRLQSNGLTFPLTDTFCSLLCLVRRASGLRLFWCTTKFVVDSALVAVKLFQPSAEVAESRQLSDALFIWVEEVLEELGVQTRHLFSTVTDAESDVKRLCLKVHGSEWEWCFPHMLNCALVEVRSVRS